MALNLNKSKPTEEPKFTVKEMEDMCFRDGEKFVSAFEQRAINEQARLQDATDSEFWIAMCFQTREQKEEFLQKFGLLAIGDKYLDGMKVAKKLGITLESPVPPNRRIQKFGGAYSKRIIE